MKQLKLISLFLFALSFSKLNAQFTITPVQPPSTFTFNDLWNLHVSGPSSTDYIEFYVTLRIFDNTTSNLILKSNSAVFGFSQIPFYATHLNMGPLDPINTLYYDFNLQNIIQNGGFFPVGVYDIQFILMGRPADGEFEEVVDFNYQMIVEAFWPPMLLDPYNQDTIDNPYPLLVWTPAFYASPGTTIEYSLWLVKLNPNQDAAQGLSSNPYIIESHNMSGTTLPYPPSAYNMQVGDQFAWQVAATVNNQPIAYTDQWTFVYYVDTLVDTTRTTENLFFNLKRVGDTGQPIEALYTVVDKIKFQFGQEYGFENEAKVSFSIRDKENHEVFNSEESNIYPMNYGMSRYVLDPCQLNLDFNAPFYKLIAYNKKREPFYMYFKLKNDINCN